MCQYGARCWLGFLRSEENPPTSNVDWFRPSHLWKLTPIPVMNKQTKQTTKPRVPSIYAFATPKNATDSGSNPIAPKSAALRRSSATHFPARFLRHFLIIRSEPRPAIGAPTVSCGKNPEAEREECKSGTNPGSQYQRVCNTLPPMLCYGYCTALPTINCRRPVLYKAGVRFAGFQ